MLSALKPDEATLSEQELELVLAVPDEWTERSELLAGRPRIDGVRLDELVRKGVIVSDEPDPDAAELRRRDETLTADHWSAQAAVHHFTTKWRDVKVDLGDEPATAESLDELIEQAAAELERYGRAPSHFASQPEPRGVYHLPASTRGGPLYDVLARRKTSRMFDADQPMTVSQLATVLHQVWGVQGIARLTQDLALLKKTSPSGGGLHPVEVYPLVVRVDGVETGLHHYRVEDHALELITPLELPEAENLVVEFTAGQTYFRPAHALFLMTIRFGRSFWKYRRQSRAYAVVLMDAAHLSQTLYLVCTELGLGAFVTAAINAVNIEDRLGVDGYSEGAILVCGCGPPGESPPGLEPYFRPYSR